VVSARTQDPASRPGGEDLSGAFTAAGAIEPPYDPEVLCLLMEHSNSLRQHVDAYATNIDGFGQRLEPAIDFDAEDADQWVADAIYIERLAARDRGDLPQGTTLQPTDEEVAERKRALQQLARVERARLESFFDFCCFDHSFVDLRRRSRQDLEVTGNAFWEVLRDGRGEIARQQRAAIRSRRARRTGANHTAPRPFRALAMQRIASKRRCHRAPRQGRPRTAEQPGAHPTCASRLAAADGNDAARRT